MDFFKEVKNIIDNVKIIPTPSWAEQLIIYEIATKGFTLPNGPESGTFNSLKEKLPYLKDLGITAIWLTGHSLAAPHHFYNIWSQYGNIEPDIIDPSLGTPEEFKAMIEEVHNYGIKIFLDVHAHGVIIDSPLVERHPGWFNFEGKLSKNWHMANYDWEGNHPDLDEWWVKIWTNCITQYGIDGFRLDVGVFRPDLWMKIRENAAKAGHPVIICSEGGRAIPGVTDFVQGALRVNDQCKEGWLSDSPLLQNLPSLYKGNSKMEKRIQDGYVTVQLSCHDSGWEGFLLNGNPFVAEGSRYVFGYSVLFTPMVPVFMSGEEFNATYKPIPWLTPKIYGGKDPGKGSWLYGAMLQWDEVKEPNHRAMLKDVKRMIAIRKQEHKILGPTIPNQKKVNILAVPYEANNMVPIPYVRWDGKAAIVVIANSLENEDVRFTLNIPLKEIGLDGHKTYNITDLWNNSKKILTEYELKHFTCSVKRDKTQGGGICVYKIEAAI